LEVVLKEAVTAYFKVLSRHLLEGLSKRKRNICLGQSDSLPTLEPALSQMLLVSTFSAKKFSLIIHHMPSDRQFTTAKAPGSYLGIIWPS
jgi:hypothetical protein